MFPLLLAKMGVFADKFVSSHAGQSVDKAERANYYAAFPQQTFPSYFKIESYFLGRSPRKSQMAKCPNGNTTLRYLIGRPSLQ